MLFVSHVPFTIPDVYKRQELVAHAENFGVTVAVEAGINHPIYNYLLAKRLVDEVASPNLKIILDCANLIHKENHADQEKVIRGALDNLQGCITAVSYTHLLYILCIDTGSIDFSMDSFPT